jgi:hypothetical protein
MRDADQAAIEQYNDDSRARLGNVKGVIYDLIYLSVTPDTEMLVMINGGARGLARQLYTDGIINSAELRAWIKGDR